MAYIDPIVFRRGLFNLRTRRFEIAADFLIKRLFDTAEDSSQNHDTYTNEKNLRIEVKFSTVNSSRDEPITLQNIIMSIEKAGSERSVPYSHWNDYKFDCYIQQVKPAEFDVLYYGLFFSDQIVIFRIEASDVPLDRTIFFKNKRYKGSVGGGQFHLNNGTMQHHLQTYLHKIMSYQTFIDLIECNDASAISQQAIAIPPAEHSLHVS